MTLPAVPMPDRVAVLVGRQIPEHVLLAETAAMDAIDELPLCLGPEARDVLAFNLRSLAAANKILAAYNPGLIVRIGGGER
ncbi:hypothetical protein M4V62_04680 [Streptomyces durmitorensis]|uniref:Uncharacterized protein n=1 Tax=Streptomyces durmitorensis TaxID=319947 RepID=A0ABY4Q599_9ACTN|nr:hypothetical protein [Streptomyces durmitorensis]UQT61373.1 hypothetical protein M4V62_04680 [Streptomyces durmitorensis]